VTLPEWFRSCRRRALRLLLPPAALSFDNYETILEESQLIAWIEKLKKAPVFAFDTGT
jgi:hypothetical protein